jgi:hypothetical protein
VSSVAHRGLVHVGMDVCKDWISVAVLPPDRDIAEVDKIFNDEESVRRLIKRLGRPSSLWACYEAGPTGYGLHRLLRSMRVRCDVVAPVVPDDLYDAPPLGSVSVPVRWRNISSILL